MKRFDNLFDKLISDQNLSTAIDKVNRTHHWLNNHRPNGITAWVELTKRDRIADLRKIINDGFVPKPAKVTERWDSSAGKMRTISEPVQWPDQYVHHALIQVLEPAFMRGMDPYCSGSIPGRGIHYAKKSIEKWVNTDIKGTKYEFCGDIRHFYDTISPEVVMDRMRSIIKDRKVLELIHTIVKDGIKIGAYTSQWFANTILQPLDQLIRQSGMCRYYVRYVDNLTIFGPNKRKLRKLHVIIEKWLHDHKLQLKSDWQIFPTSKRLPDAVGYRYGVGYTLPRKKNLLKLKRAISKFLKNKNITAKTASGMLSMIGQLKHCGNVNLYKMLFGGRKIVKQLKTIVRNNHRKELITWSTFLAQMANSRSFERRAIAIQN